MKKLNGVEVEAEGLTLTNKVKELESIILAGKKAASELARIQNFCFHKDINHHFVSGRSISFTCTKCHKKWAAEEALEVIT